jgi:hypothetical protein
MAENSLKKRGIFLTVLVILGVIGALMIFFSGIIYPITGIGLGSDAGKLTLLVSALEFIPLIAALYGIWKWKKWGVYSLIVYILISILSTFIFDILLKIYTGYAQYVILIDIFEAAIWFWAISRKWSYFL